jgi:hypothetical protein
MVRAQVIDVALLLSTFTFVIRYVIIMSKV